MTTDIYLSVIGCVLATCVAVAVVSGLFWVLYMICIDIYRDIKRNKDVR